VPSDGLAFSDIGVGCADTSFSFVMLVLSVGEAT
jgi:hypothetical protein